jgi:beta-xylosidase
MYGTGGGAENGFMAYSSTDLKEWHPEGQVYKADEDSWALKNFWAPEVYEKNGKYYLFFSADWKYNPTNELENFRIGVAVSNSPLGPFKELINRPIFDPGYPIIDANILFEGDTAYLYYSRCCYKNPVESDVATWAKKEGLYEEIEESWVYGVQISSNFDTIIGEPKLLLRPPVKSETEEHGWESRSVTSGEVNRRWTEGSFIFKKNEQYYMMYSANFFGGKHYAVGYATANNPLGPFKKAKNNPVLEKNTNRGGVVSGTGHNSITWSKDGKDMYCVYHGRTTTTGDERVVFIDKMEIDENGLLNVFGPTVSK